MNKTFLLSWVVIFIAWMLGSFVVHGVLLNSYYADFPNLYRTQEETQAFMHYMLLAHVLLAGAFVWIYQRGVTSAAWPGHGLRFGVAHALLMPIPGYMFYYVVQPMSGALAIRQALGDTLLLIVLALIAAFLNRNLHDAKD